MAYFDVVWYKSDLWMVQDAERKYKKRRLQKEKVEITEAVKKTHREKVEELNQKLATLTEHNDIPRISAAGNG